MSNKKNQSTITKESDEKSKLNLDKLFYENIERMSRNSKLTIDQLRKYKGQENISDQEALEKIDGLYKFSIITYKIYCEDLNKKAPIDESGLSDFNEKV